MCCRSGSAQRKGGQSCPDANKTQWLVQGGQELRTATEDGGRRREGKKTSEERERKRHFWMDKEDESATGESIGIAGESVGLSVCASVCVSR